MSNEVDHKQLIYIIESAPGFTSGEYDGILSGDDSVVNNFKSAVISFCSGDSVEADAIEKIVNTADFACVKNVIAGLKNGKISDLDSVECGKFATEFVNEVKGKEIKIKIEDEEAEEKDEKVEGKIKKVGEKIKKVVEKVTNKEVTIKFENKEWHHQIVIMQCAIIDAIHTIFKECDGLLTCVDSGIILGLATGFKHWFENSRIEDSNFGKIDIADKVDSFLKEKLNLNTENSYNIFSVPWGLEQIFECFKKSYDADINKWTKECNALVDAYKTSLNSEHDVAKLKKQLNKIAININNNGTVDDKLITKLSKTLNRIFNVGDVYLIKKKVESSVNAVKQKRQQKLKSSDNAQQPQSVKPENESNIPESKISVTKDSATEGCFESPVIEKVTMTSLEQHAEYIDQQFEKFFKSFEESYDSDVTTWWGNLICLFTLQDDRLADSLWALMQCVTGEEYSDISAKVMELSKVLCEIFAVDDIASVTKKLEEIIQRVKERQKRQKNAKGKYNADIVENLLKVIDCVAAQGCVDLSSESNIWVLINDELYGFEDLLETADKWQCAINVIHEVLQGINGDMDPGTIAQSSATLLVHLGVINTGDKDKAKEKIKGKIEELRNRRKKGSSTAQKEPAPQPQIVETNAAQVQQETSSPAKKPQELTSQTSEGTSEPDLEKDETLQKLDKFLDTPANNLGDADCVNKACSVLGDYSKNVEPQTGKFINSTKYDPAICASQGAIALSDVLGNTLNVADKKEWIKEQLLGIYNAWPTNFKKEGSKAKRLVKRVVDSANHSLIKGINISGITYAINKLPSEYKELGKDKLRAMSSFVRVNGCATSLNLDLNITANSTLKDFKKAANVIRKEAKKSKVDSDAVVVIVVLYKTSDVAISLKEEQAKELFNTFAKWFNKYVSPRSAIRSPKVVDALNDTVGKMAKDQTMFKYGKLTRAKNAIKGLAKKGSKSSGASVGANSGSEGHKKRKRDKITRRLKDFSLKNLSSRKKKGEANEGA